MPRQETSVEFRKIPWRKERLPIPVFLGFPCDSASEESAYHAGDLGSIPRLGRSPGERKGYPVQYSGLEKSMDCRVHGVAKSQTQLLSLRIISVIGKNSKDTELKNEQMKRDQ